MNFTDYDSNCARNLICLLKSKQILIASNMITSEKCTYLCKIFKKSIFYLIEIKKRTDTFERNFTNDLRSCHRHKIQINCSKCNNKNRPTSDDIETKMLVAQFCFQCGEFVTLISGKNFEKCIEGKIKKCWYFLIELVDGTFLLHSCYFCSLITCN